MPKEKLSPVVQAAIQHWILEGKSNKDILALLDTNDNEELIISYIETCEKEWGTLPRGLQDTVDLNPSKPDNEPVSKTEESDIPILETEQEPVNQMLEDMKVYAIHKLIQEGLEREQAEGLVEGVLKTGFEPESEQQLYVKSVMAKSDGVTAANFMVTKTSGGREGVSIMTGVASERTDESSIQARHKASSRSTRDAVYQPKNGTMRRDELGK